MVDVWVWIWLAVVCGSALIEFLTMQMVSIWFVAGGLLALILALCSVPLWIQLLVFIIVSLVLLLSLRKLCMKLILKNTNAKTNVDTLVGQEHKLIEEIGLEKSGSLKANGIVWTAVAENDKTKIKSGTLVTIVEVKGNKLIVREKEE